MNARLEKWMAVAAILMIPVIAASVTHQLAGDQGKPIRQLTSSELHGSLRSVERAVSILHEYARQVMFARVTYLGVLASDGNDVGKRASQTGVFHFVGDADKWGQVYWTCRMIPGSTGTINEFCIKTSDGVIWFSIDAVGRNYEEVSIAAVARNDGTKLRSLLDNISSFKLKEYQLDDE